MKKISLIIVLIILLVIAGFVAHQLYLHFGPNKTLTRCEKLTQDLSSGIEKNQVIYQDGCFMPNPLKVKVGDSVIFTDKSDQPMWIISDTKPKTKDELVLRSFNSGQAWGKGQSYGYSFDTPGTYGYHNKEKPEDKGTIIVEK